MQLNGGLPVFVSLYTSLGTLLDHLLY